jgi:anti-sigma B factor antagonist
MSHELELVTNKRGLAAIMQVGGVLDLHGAERFEGEIRRLLRGNTREIVVDLRLTVFLDSIGLRCLVTAQRRAQQAGVPLWIVRGGAPVARVLRMTGLDAALPLIDDLPRRLRQRRPLSAAHQDMRISSGNT